MNVIGFNERSLPDARIPVWILGTACALALHLAVCAILTWHAEAPLTTDELAGNVVFELSPLTTTIDGPADTQSVMPPTPEAAASVEQAQMKADPVAQQEAPVAIPSPTPPDPELAVPERTEERPETKQPPVDHPDKRETEASALSIAAQANAPPVIDAPKSPTMAAPVVGISPTAARSEATWLQSVAAHLNRFKRFPDEAKRHAESGQVIIDFAINREGRVISSRIAQSSSIAALDREALDMVQRAAPFPKPSTDIVGAEFAMTIPVLFKIK